MKSISPYRPKSRRPVSHRAMLEPLEERRLMARILGVDVSTYQGSINWTSVANDGISFAYIRSGYGTSGVDNYFTTNAVNALNAGLYIGYYHYAYYEYSSNTPIAEADHYWNLISPYMVADGKHLMPFLDVEDGATAGDGESLSAWVDNFCLELQKKAAAAGLSIIPLVYGSSSHMAAASSGYFATVDNIPLPAIHYPLDVANYLSSNTGSYLTGNPPAGTGIWPQWAMWQYTSSETTDNGFERVDGISGNVDRDVLNGDLNTLKDYLVQKWEVGAQVTANPQPTYYSPSTPLPTAVKVYATYNTKAANDSYTLVDAYTGGTILAKGSAKDGDGNQRWQVQFANGVTGWIVQDANYIVRNLAGRWPVGSYVTTRGVTGKILQGPVYTNGYQRWQVQFSNGVTGWDNEDLLTTTTPSALASPSPANSTTAFLTSLPSTFTWTGANASSYDIYLDGVKQATVTTNSWTHPTIADGTHTWYVVSHNAELTTTGATWTFKLDSAAPLATYGGQLPVQGASSFTFTVTYTDSNSGILYSSLGTGDLLVTGPNGFSQTATLVSVDTTTNGTPRTATYSINAPGGIWNVLDNGAYTLSQVASQVRDVAGNFRPAGTVGTFSLNLPPAYLSGSSLIIDYPIPGTITISASGDNIVVTQEGNDYTFAAASVALITVNTTSGDDLLILSGNLSVPVSLSAGGDNDSVVLNPGASAAFASDLPGDAVTVGSGATLTASVPLHLRGLTIDGGSVQLPTGGATPLTVGDLTILNSGRLDLADNALTWNYTGASPADTLRTYLYNGRNGGTWDGTNGIIASSPLGYLDTTSLLVQPTPAGDANLDGVVNADDYALTDRSFAMGTLNPHWLDGDYDYSGSLDANDYFLLDSSAAAAAAPSPYLMAIRLATFGPDYVDALENPAAAPAPASLAVDPFSSTPIKDSAAETQDKVLPLQPVSSPVAFTFPSLQSDDDLFDDLMVN